jgi:hypothetical protein
MYRIFRITFDKLSRLSWFAALFPVRQATAAMIHAVEVTLIKAANLSVVVGEGVEKVIEHVCIRHHASVELL